nr:hypothetical protein [Kibdelosporangium sp. MJ126-NF4]CTQ99225.1 hypothetical protein [Kibdelosporangium sp. MJ126-NF4]
MIAEEIAARITSFNEHCYGKAPFRGEILLGDGRAYRGGECIRVR